MGWVSPNSSLSWQVDNTTTPGKWHYRVHDLTSRKASGRWEDIQRVIVEASNGTRGPMFTIGRPVRRRPASPANWLQTVEVGTARALGQPEPAAECVRHQVQHGERRSRRTDDQLSTTDRAPVWGDFYARSYVVDGHFNALYNWGLMRIPEIRSVWIRPVTGASWTTSWSRIPCRFPRPPPLELSLLWHARRLPGRMAAAQIAGL